MYSQIIKEGFLNLGIVKIPNSTLKPFPKQNHSLTEVLFTSD